MSSDDGRQQGRTTRPDCPSWCAVDHDPARGEDDWVHRGTALHLADDVEAQLCASIDPRTGERDGPYVLMGSVEYTLDEASSLGLAIIEMTELGAVA